MLKIVRITFSIIALLLATLGLLTHNALFLPYMFLSLGLMCFFSGIAEFQKQQASTGILLFLAGAFALYIPLWEVFR
ncbi:Protein of unknown function [Bacillus sp. 491mf]|uniref:YczI family protein n=1 Tax=Bacillus sp. 491mf TaxID=1761755 RepID=UPI0008ECF408|nr:YczI family protein [Bacillus sp. 491mf]SFD47368.1 Protein of unknown function [Bacillus sp. 491mf]